jgi:hypothetical protein
MAALWVLLIAVAAYIITITLVVIGQEVHPLLSVVLFLVVAYGAVKLFQARVTGI